MKSLVLAIVLLMCGSASAYTGWSSFDGHCHHDHYHSYRYPSYNPYLYRQYRTQPRYYFYYSPDGRSGVIYQYGW